MTSVEINIPNFDEMIEEVVREFVQNHDFTDYVDLDEFCTNDSAYDIARDVCDDYDHGSSEVDVHELNSLLNQVSEGRDCSDGEPFREAVKAIINAQALSNGSGVSDGTPMTLKVSGQEREVQAILTRRKEYFEAVTREIYNAFNFSPGHTQSPNSFEGDLDEWTGIQIEKSDDYKTDLNEQALSSTETVTLNKVLFDAFKAQHTELGHIAVETIKLLGLLNSLQEGCTGEQALRHANKWADTTSYALETRVTLPEHIGAEDKANDVPH